MAACAWKALPYGGGLIHVIVDNSVGADEGRTRPLERTIVAGPDTLRDDSSASFAV